MSKQRKILLIILAGVIVITLGLIMGLRQGSHELAARHKIDSLLGQANDDVFPEDTSPFTPYSAAPATPPSPNSTASPLLAGIPDSGVDVQESSTAYVIRIPLLTAEDARNVKVNVTPHHIELSGNIGRQQQNVIYSSSFVQSFSTSQTVLPEKMTQKTYKIGSQAELVITIPKKQGNQPNLSPPPAPVAPTAPKATGEPFLEDDGTEHRVI
jgi:hypothetical protein